MDREIFEAKLTSSLNCGQIVFSSFTEDTGIPEDQAQLLTSAFGSGMYSGDTCGAVVGALLVLGTKFGTHIPVDQYDMEKMREKGNMNALGNIWNASPRSMGAVCAGRSWAPTAPRRKGWHSSRRKDFISPSARTPWQTPSRSSKIFLTRIKRTCRKPAAGSVLRRGLFFTLLSVVFFLILHHFHVFVIRHSAVGDAPVVVEFDDAVGHRLRHLMVVG